MFRRYFYGGRWECFTAGQRQRVNVVMNVMGRALREAGLYGDAYTNEVYIQAVLILIARYIYIDP